MKSTKKNAKQSRTNLISVLGLGLENVLRETRTFLFSLLAAGGELNAQRHPPPGVRHLDLRSPPQSNPHMEMTLVLRVEGQGKSRGDKRWCELGRWRGDPSRIPLTGARDTNQNWGYCAHHMSPALP